MDFYFVLHYTKTTDTATRGTEQLRSTGELVGLGDRAETNEIIEDTPIEEKAEAKESGENDELR